MENSALNPGTQAPRRRRRRPPEPPSPAQAPDLPFQVLLPGEDPQAFDAHRQAVLQQFRPSTPYNSFLAGLAAGQSWELCRTTDQITTIRTAEIDQEEPAIVKKYEEIDPLSRNAFACSGLGLRSSYQALLRIEDRAFNRFLRLHRLLDASTRKPRP